MPYTAKDIKDYNNSLVDLRKKARAKYATLAAKVIDTEIQRKMERGVKITEVKVSLTEIRLPSHMDEGEITTAIEELYEGWKATLKAYNIGPSYDGPPTRCREIRLSTKTTREHIPGGMQDL